MVSCICGVSSTVLTKRCKIIQRYVPKSSLAFYICYSVFSPIYYMKMHLVATQTNLVVLFSLSYPNLPLLSNILQVLVVGRWPARILWTRNVSLFRWVICASSRSRTDRSAAHTSCLLLPQVCLWLDSILMGGSKIVSCSVACLPLVAVFV